MILVSNGCSHTAGAELEYAYQGECYDRAWPKHLADSLDYDHINLSMSGASTNRIVRTTYEFIYNWIKQGKSVKEKRFAQVVFTLLQPQQELEKPPLHLQQRSRLQRPHRIRKLFSFSPQDNPSTASWLTPFVESTPYDVNKTL